MSINGFYLSPHPPIIIPEVGMGEEKKILDTTNSLNEIADEIGREKPDTIIIVSPHGTMFRDAIAIVYKDTIHGNLREFNAPEVSMNLNIDKKLSSRIYEIAMERKIPTVMLENSLLSKYNISVKLDHGAIVPLYFVNKYYRDYKIVHITYAPLSDISLYKFGIAIKKAVDELDENAIFIASGDLSHRLKSDGPYGYNSCGKKFDSQFLTSLKSGNLINIFTMDKKIIKNAGQCGRRSVLIMLGALDGKKFKGDILSYQSNFGVGYGVMRLNTLLNESSRLQELEKIRLDNYSKKLSSKDPYTRLARKSLTNYLSTGEKLKALPEYAVGKMKDTKNGVFVSLKKDGNLRGCIGTILPTCNSTAEEIVNNAIEAGTRDPRFMSVDKSELPDIDFSVDVLTEPEVCNIENLDPKQYGVIVIKGKKTGVLLPDLEGVDTVEDQISIALKKAGINPDENYKIERFKVTRHIEQP